MTMERSCIGFAGSGDFSREDRAGTERSLRRFCIVRAVFFVSSLYFFDLGVFIKE